MPASVVEDEEGGVKMQIEWSVMPPTRRVHALPVSTRWRKEALKLKPHEIPTTRGKISELPPSQPHVPRTQPPGLRYHVHGKRMSEFRTREDSTKLATGVYTEGMNVWTLHRTKPCFVQELSWCRLEEGFNPVPSRRRVGRMPYAGRQQWKHCTPRRNPMPRTWRCD
jgi:hypothetical protein